MKKLMLVFLNLLYFSASYTMDAPLQDQHSINKSFFSGLVPSNPARQAFNALSHQDSVSFRIESTHGVREVLVFLKNFEEGEAEANAKHKDIFKTLMPGYAYREYKNTLKLEKIIAQNSWLYLTYSYLPSRAAGLGFAGLPINLEFKTKIPTGYPDDIVALDIDSFEEISASSSDSYGREVYAELYGKNLINKEDEKLLIKYAGLIPVNQYRSAFNGFSSDEYVLMHILDEYSSNPKTRKVAYKIYGGPENLDDYRKNLRPSKTSLVTNYNYLELISIAEENNYLVLEFGYLRVKSRSYNKFKVCTQIPHNYPHEDLSYMTQSLVQQKVNAPINNGALAGLNARDLGKIFNPCYEGLIIRSQYLKPLELETVNAYIQEAAKENLKTSMNLNIHGFGGGHIKETYSLEEINKCESMSVICIHPYHKNPQRRAYVDGVDPRTIPQASKDRGNVYNNGTIKYFFSEEAQQMLGLKFNDASGKWGFGEENFEPAILAGDVIDLINSVKNFLQAGLPGVFHCKGGIHRTGQVEALFILLFAGRDNSIAMWSNPAAENLSNLGNYRLKGYFSDFLNCACGRSDKGFAEVLSGSFYENRKVTPIEWNYVLSSQGMPRQENIDFIRDFGRFAQVFDELMKTHSTIEDAYQDFLSKNILWVTQEIFMSWFEVVGIFNMVINELVK